MERPVGIGRLGRGRKVVRQKPRVTVASRIHLPEPAAASFRLDGVEKALLEAGAEVSVVTTAYPGAEVNDPAELAVSRHRALRAADGALKGYLPYMSFDLPLFGRLFCQQNPNVVVVEPPPTTGAVVRLWGALTRTPYIWYAADVWSDATKISGAPKIVTRVLRAVERFAIRGAAGIIAVSEGVAKRQVELGAKNVAVVPNGIDTDLYSPSAARPDAKRLAEWGITGPYLIYAGTASEWQGATVFAEALRQVRKTHPEVQLVFVGQGSDWEKIGTIADELNTGSIRPIVMIPTLPADEVAGLIAGAELALVSIVPDQGYDFAYPTKVLAAWASGVPVVYAGKGPVADDIRDFDLGWVSEHNPEAVGNTIDAALNLEDRTVASAKEIRNWVLENRSKQAMGTAAADFILQTVTDGLGGPNGS